MSGRPARPTLLRDGASLRGLTVVLALALALVLTFVLTACGGDPATAPAAESSGAAGTSASSSPGATGAASPTASPTPTFPPAAGPRLRNRWVELRAPAGWELDPYAGDLMKTAYDPATGDAVYVGGFPVRSRDLDRLAREARKVVHYLDDAERMPDRLLVDREAFHFEAVERDPRSWNSDFGTYAGGLWAVSINFALKSPSQERRTEIVESVLASIEWQS